MNLQSLTKLMRSCNPDAEVKMSTSDGEMVTLTWCFMGVTHNIRTPIHCVSMSNKKFQRKLHAARVVIRCRSNLRKLYQSQQLLREVTK